MWASKRQKATIIMKELAIIARMRWGRRGDARGNDSTTTTNDNDDDDKITINYTVDY